MRSGIGVCLVVLVFLAGCQGAPGAGTGATPSPEGAAPAGSETLTDEEATPDPPNASTFSYPPGANPQRLDPTVVPGQHTRALVESGQYTLTRFRTLGNRTIQTRLAVDHGRQRMVGTQRVLGPDGDLESGGPRTGDLYATGDTLYRRQQGRQLSDGSALVNYDRTEQNWSTRALTARSTLRSVLEAYRFEADGVTLQEGTPSVRYRSSDPRGNDSRATLRANASVRLTLDERGIVRSLSVRRADGATVGFRVTNVSTAVVTRPAWVDEVPGESTPSVPNATFAATSRTVELRTRNASLETTAVSITHEGGESIDAAALDVTVARERAYDVREQSTTNETLVPVRPFARVGETFDPGESVRVIHTVPPDLYGGTVTIDGGSIAGADRSGNETFPTLEDERSIEPGQELRVLWNRSDPRTLLTDRVQTPASNRTLTAAS